MKQAARQLDLFGGAAAVAPGLAKRKFLTMQEMHGTDGAHVCRECACLVKMNHGKVVYKCMKWKFTPNAESDVDPAQVACVKFVEY